MTAAGDGKMKYCRKPCDECPWRRDVPVGKFPPERFVQLAGTNYDMSAVQFACHKSHEDREFACAGFLLSGAANNLGVRLARSDLRKIESPYPMFDTFREMAVANGVDPDDPALENCRYWTDHRGPR